MFYKDPQAIILSIFTFGLPYRMENKPIILAPYDPLWPAFYNKESQVLADALGYHAEQIEHIGSTSIEGMIAKPKIDILCVVDKLESSQVLKDHGYSFGGELNLPLRYYFAKRHPVKFNLHVVEKGNGFIALNLTFRDYLRAHPLVQEEYAQLKKNLLLEAHNHNKVVDCFSGYNLGKNKFIKKILQQAGYKGSYASFCMHEQEWEDYYKLLKIPYSNDHQHISFDNNQKIDSKYHFVWYQGTEIIGAARLEKMPSNKFMLGAYKLTSTPQISYEADDFKTFLKRWAQSKHFELVEEPLP